MRIYITSFLLCLSLLWNIKPTFGQDGWFKPDTAIVVTKGGSKLLNPWAGGLNAMQFCKMDLNFDGTEDLVVFDRTNSKISTYTAGTVAGNSNKIYQYAPAYELRFPHMDNWMILADYDNDGLKDLFASTSLGITVYKQVRSGSSFEFVLQRDALYTRGLSGPLNLQVGGTDIPAITDIDGDGDLDVLTFDFSGTYIELHQNLSMEKFGVPDSLGTSAAPVYARNGQCWGNFHKGDNNDFVFGDDCGVIDMSGMKILHAGNSILLHDVNGDGFKDLLVGHISNDHISVLYNTVPGIAADFTSFTHNYPVADPIQFQIFPAVFMEDIDFDGVKDLIASPNVSSNEGNLMDFQSSNWYYHNSGTDGNPVFELKQKNFLQDQMLDVGENAAPSFFDIDGDGDMDMIIGTGGVANNGDFKGKLILLRNNGTASNPSFDYESDNYLNIPASFSIYNIKPQWADFNGDGIVDLGFAGISPVTLKFEYRYIPNRATAGGVQLNLGEAVTIAMPDSQIGDSPFFYDTDKDGDLDLLVGKPQGNIVYYKNTGSAKQYTFNMETDQFAGVSLNYEGRYVAPVISDIDLDGKLDLLTVDHSGNIRIFYDGEFGAWTKRESLLVKYDGKGTAPELGNYLYASVADYNQDGKPDVAVGTNAGGVRIFANILPVVITGVEPSTGFAVKTYPNPADEIVTVYSSENALLNIVNLSGKVVRKNISIVKNLENRIETKNLPTGLYLFEIVHNDEKLVKKVLIK